MSKSKTVLCYGDSNTHGYNPTDGSRYPREIRWTGKLQKMLGDTFNVVEEGCNGRTTMFGDSDGWINGMLYLRPCLYSHRTIDYVVLMLGTNDLKSTFHASSQKIGQGIERLVTETITFLKDHQAYVPRIILIAPPVLGAGMKDSAFSDEFNEESVAKSFELAEIYRGIATQYHCSFLNASEFATVSEADSLHLSAESHGAFADAVYQCISAIEEHD